MRKGKGGRGRRNVQQERIKQNKGTQAREGGEQGAIMNGRIEGGGARRGEAFENTTRVWTNQTTMTYCMTAQEDSSVLHAIMRGAVWGKVDYSRAILMRSGMYPTFVVVFVLIKGCPTSAD